MNKKRIIGCVLGAVLLAVLVGGYLITTRIHVFTYRDYPMLEKPNVPVSQHSREDFITDEQGRVQYVKDGKTARTGIDVSSHQGKIDWSAVAQDGIDFAIIRAGFRGYGEGELNPDKMFERNIKGALAAGLDVGIYFFSQALSPEEAVEEAEYVLDAIRDYNVTLPVAFDWEPIKPGKNARTDGLDGATVTECARAFCDRIRQAGLEPLVYLNQDMGYLTFRLDKLTDFKLWLAEYDTAPDFHYAFRIWQYSNTGKVAGIKNKVDLNLWFED